MNDDRTDLAGGLMRDSLTYEPLRSEGSNRGNPRERLRFAGLDLEAGYPRMLAHNVYFTLKDPSPQAIESMVAACKKSLSIQPGIVFFAAGSLAGQYQREVNDRDFHVALHVIFATAADQDAYQDDPQHKVFIEENRAQWAKVRVFDSNAEHAS